MNFHAEYRCMSRATLPEIQLYTGYALHLKLLNSNLCRRAGMSGVLLLRLLVFTSFFA